MASEYLSRISIDLHLNIFIRGKLSTWKDLSWRTFVISTGNTHLEWYFRRSSALWSLNWNPRFIALRVRCAKIRRGHLFWQIERAITINNSPVYFTHRHTGLLGLNQTCFNTNTLELHVNQVINHWLTHSGAMIIFNCSGPFDKTRLSILEGKQSLNWYFDQAYL